MGKKFGFKNTQERDNFIISQKKEGRSTAEIAKKTKLSERQVQRIYSAYLSKGKLGRKRGSGRKTALSALDKKRIRNKLRSNPYKSLKTIKAELNLKASEKTISRYLVSINWSYKKATKIPKLTQDHKVKRVTWAENHIDLDWSQVIFSDECTFVLNQPRYGWSQKGSRIQQESLCYNPKVQVWGSICSEGVVHLKVFEGTMNSKMYIETLGDGFINAADEIMGDEWIFQHDNARAHTAKKTKDFLNDNVPEVLPWPSNSPDLNPIENLWGKLKQQVYSRNPRDTNQLTKFVYEEIDKIPKKFYSNLFDSMEQRMEIVIESEGNAILY